MIDWRSPTFAPYARWIVLALWVVAAVFVLLAVGQWWASTSADDRLDALVTRLDPPPAQADASSDDAGKDGPPEDAPDDSADAPALANDDPGVLAAKRIDERYIFHSKPQPRFRQIRGVLGNKVLFTHGGAVAVGGSFDGATVKEVGANWVKLEHEGEEITIAVAGGSPNMGGDRPRQRRARGRRDAAPKDDKPKTASADDGRITKDDIDPAKIAAKFGVPVEMVEAQLDSLSDEDFQQQLEESDEDITEFLYD